MKFQSALLLALLSAVLGTTASAQTPILTFNPTLTEHFDTRTAGISPGFRGFTAVPNGTTFATFSPFPSFADPSVQNLCINNRANVLPPQSPLNNLYGIGNDVRIKFQLVDVTLTKFSGFFSRTNIAAGVTQVTLQFFVGPTSQPVGVPVTVNLPPTGGGANYVPVVLQLPSAFDEVRIIGNSTTFGGYVGIDTLGVAP